MELVYKKLLVNWKSLDNTNYAVGTLEFSGDSYTFKYNKTICYEAEKKGFSPFIGLSDLESVYHSKKLFSIFDRRIPSKERNIFRKFVKEHKIKSSNYIEWEYLTITKGRLATDSISFVAPIIYVTDREVMLLSSEIAGWSYTERKVINYEISEPVIVRKDIKNTYDKEAIEIVFKNRVINNENLKVGYIPKPFNQVFYRLLDRNIDVQASIYYKRVEDNRPLIVVFAEVPEIFLELESDLQYMIEFQEWDERT